MTTRPVVCPSGKTGFTSADAARVHAIKHGLTLDAYQCRIGLCGRYHLTAEVERKDQTK